jgi:hypothetical protein
MRNRRVENKEGRVMFWAPWGPRLSILPDGEGRFILQFEDLNPQMERKWVLERYEVEQMAKALLDEVSK